VSIATISVTQDDDFAATLCLPSPPQNFYCAGILLLVILISSEEFVQGDPTKLPIEMLHLKADALRYSWIWKLEKFKG